MKFLYATTNSGKLEEAKKVANRVGVELIGVDEIAGNEGVSTHPPLVEETAADYEGNARLKAAAYFQWAGIPVIADDAGLEVEALNGAPGVHTARFAGPDASMADNRDKLLKVLEGADNRRARFVCVLCVFGLAEVVSVQKHLQGTIAVEEDGKGGFGYDSIFIPEGYLETLAALKEQEIAVPTHRVLAFEILAVFLQQLALTE